MNQHGVSTIKLSPKDTLTLKRFFSTKARNIVITMHDNPDGDALGSSLALYHVFTKLGHNVTVISPNRFPAFLAWMPENKKVVIYSQHARKAKQAIAEAEMIFSLDYNSIYRLSAFADQMIKSSATKVLIDHHPQPEISHFDYIKMSVHASSTAELVYEFLVELGLKKHIDLPTAENIYVGIITDTGSFSYSCNYENTYNIVAELIKLGVDGERIHHLVYDTYSEDRIRLLGYCLSEKLIILPEYHSAYITLTKADLKQFKFQIGDSEGIVNYALSVQGISFAALFMEKEDHVKISLRSKGEFSVNEYIRKHFEGGGHRNAAGGKNYASLQETIASFKNSLTIYKEKLHKCADQN